MIAEVVERAGVRLIAGSHQPGAKGTTIPVDAALLSAAKPGESLAIGRA
jgi:hypothetical protein